MGSKRLDSFNDCFNHRVRVQIRCWQCGRERILEQVNDSLFKERGMRSNMSVMSIIGKLKCGNCGAKQPKVQLLMPWP